MDYWALVDQPEQRGPGGRVERGDDVHSLPRFPRCSGPDLPGQLPAQGVEPGLRFSIGDSITLQDVDELSRGQQADLVVQHCPPHLKHRHEIPIDRV